MLNLDFSKPITIATEQETWQNSPMQGVLRKPLSRDGAEHGHATSIVQYQAGSSFKAHQHPLGEEILVLEGVFSDEHGDYPKGTYIRNPDGTSHAPFSQPGCTIFVKLHQFQTGDNKQFTIDTSKGEWQDISPYLPNQVQALTLHKFNQEKVFLVKIKASAPLPILSTQGGEEALIISGELSHQGRNFAKGTWFRYPKAHLHHFTAKTDTILWLKTGHLPV